MKTTFTLLVLLFYNFLSAQFGRYNMLDNSFGTNGKISTSITGKLNTEGTTTKSVLLQKDGKIIIAGELKTGTISNLLFARFYANGTLDSSFGKNGFIIYANSTWDLLYQAQLQSDDKIVAVIKSGSKRYLIRLTQAGIDSSFGINGLAALMYKGYSLDINNDKIIAGENYKQNGKLVCGVQRFTNDGKPDSLFGINSFSSLVIGSDPMVEELSRIRFDKTGKIVIGSTWNKASGSSEYPYLIILRFTSNGLIDSSFNKNGLLVLSNIENANSLTAIAIQQDNKIVAGARSGEGFHPDGNFLVMRVKQNGVTDSSFGENGFVITDFNYNPNANPKKFDVLSALLIQADSRIIAVGSSSEYYGENSQFALCRYNLNGSLDQSFGFHGRLITKFENSNEAGATDAALQPDGKIVAAGYHDTIVQVSTFSNFGIARYNEEKKNSQQSIIADATIKTNNNSIFIYPNPAKNVLNIQGLSSNQKIQLTVLDFSGNIAISQQLSPVPSNTGANSTSYNLNIASLKAGNYLLKIEMNNSVVTKKFVKE